MQFLFPWMQPDLSIWLDRNIHRNASRESVPRPFHDLTEATLAVEEEGPPEANGPFRRVSDSILSYRIFGPRIGEPITLRGKVRVGDTLGLRYRLLPGLSLFFASRVVSVFEEEDGRGGWRSGFIYQTLEKHPELGEEIFEVRKDLSGAVTLRIEAWSRPNLWYVKLFTPWSRKIQRRAARCAQEYLTEVARGGGAT